MGLLNPLTVTAFVFSVCFCRLVTISTALRGFAQPLRRTWGNVVCSTAVRLGLERFPTISVKFPLVFLGTGENHRKMEKNGKDKQGMISGLENSGK